MAQRTVGMGRKSARVMVFGDLNQLPSQEYDMSSTQMGTYTIEVWFTVDGDEANGSYMALDNVRFCQLVDFARMVGQWIGLDIFGALVSISRHG